MKEFIDFPDDYKPANLSPSEFDNVTGALDDFPNWDDEVSWQDTDSIDWDEPEPLAEYDSELRQPIYSMDDDDDGSLRIELRIDEWLAKLDTISAVERCLMVELLNEIGYGRMGWWLSWLDKQQWTNETLLLFLRFRAHWESRPHWWEYSYWSWRAHCWYPTRSRYSLSWDGTYELVHRRLDCRPDEIIDETWLGDWLDMALWRHGFRSFASFAIFRAGFESGNNWMQQIDWHEPDDWSQNGLGSRWNNGSRLYSYGPPTWFAEQDWYDPYEWHDNLGW